MFLLKITPNKHPFPKSCIQPCCLECVLVLLSIVIVSLGEDRAGLYMLLMHVSLFYNCYFLSFFSSSLCHDPVGCSTHWTFHLTFFFRVYTNRLKTLLWEIIYGKLYKVQSSYFSWYSGGASLGYFTGKWICKIKSLLAIIERSSNNRQFSFSCFIFCSW